MFNKTLYQVSKLLISLTGHEPETLSEEHDAIVHQTQKLAFDNYSTFVQAAECSKEIYKDVSSARYILSFMHFVYNYSKNKQTISF